jgi:thiosulfate dehydrogenase
LKAVYGFISFLSLGTLLLGVSSTSGFQGPTEETELGPVFLLSLGGKLYDDLWLVLDEEPPAGRNPAVPADATVSDRASWRCVSCHGWSYAGGQVGGAIYPGLKNLSAANSEAVQARILDPAHPFPAFRLSDLAAQILAYFITEGLYDTADFFDDGGRALGNPEFGQDIFEGACINCHQLDGRRYLEGEQGDRSSLGWVSRERPEQALHKILNGVPAAEMLSLRFLSEAQIADLFAYLQTLDSSER